MRTQSPSSVAIDLFVRQVLAPELGNGGFRRRGRAFTRRSHDVYHCVDVQASRWNSPTEASFTVNLRVTWPRWHEVISGQPFPRSPTSAADVASERLGSLVFGEDRWWKLQLGQDMEPLARELLPALAHGVPRFFVPFASTTECLDHLDRGRPLPGHMPSALVHATLLVDAGRLQEAERVLTETIRAQPDWETPRIVAQRLRVAGAA